MEEIVSLNGVTIGPKLTYEKTNLDMLGREIVEPVLKLSINDGPFVLLASSQLERILFFLKDKG